MKICNNCDTENPAGVEKCGHCHMIGNFRHQVPAGQKSETVPKTIQCGNCGSCDPGSGAKCHHCHFPLPTPAQAQPFTKLSLQANLRAG